ncbi:MAG: GNAT family N-acetyltransferase [Burkholderiales bacterium]|nr:GNAT family N-acetyltransferase [Burkholderiales bacterium]
MSIIKITDELSDDQILAICNIKNQIWAYTIESQLAWWANNTNKDDKYFISLKNDKVLAFLRLRTRVVSINGEILNAFCVTEVCVDNQLHGGGLGKQLLAAATKYIKNITPNMAYLLCKDVQEAFYLKCGWHCADGVVQIKSNLKQSRRRLASNERCMTLDLQNRMHGEIILFGECF